MNMVRPTGPKGVTWKVMGTADSTSRSTTATERPPSARGDRATAAAMAAKIHPALPTVSNTVMIWLSM